MAWKLLKDPLRGVQLYAARMFVPLPMATGWSQTHHGRMRPCCTRGGIVCNVLVNVHALFTCEGLSRPLPVPPKSFRN